MTMLSRSVVRGLILAMAVGTVIGMTGCTDSESKRPSTTQPVIAFPTQPLRKVPDYLKGTIYEQTTLLDTKPFLVSGFGLMVHLRGTGDNSAIPTPIREQMVKELLVHGFGSHRIEGYEKVDAERVMRDPTTAVVRVDGYVPPGARKGDNFDVLVSALDESYTKSLAHGTLYETDLKYMGGDPNNPMISVNAYARAYGQVFVNPAYALLSPKQIDATTSMSLRYGVIMSGGVSRFDNPLVLSLREPEFRLAGGVQRRIDQRFQNEADHTNKVGRPGLAEAQNQKYINVYVPRKYRGNWEHFAGVVQHLYLVSNPSYLAQKAVELGNAAAQPNAPLENISYALEGIGQPAAGVCYSLMKNPSPEVQFAAARAMAFIGDDSGEARDLLLKIAKTPEHPFRISAVKVLSDMPDSLETSQYLRQLLSNDNALVRIEAYKALAATQDSAIYTKVIQEKFALDLVPSSGPPMIYATRRGIPRIAIFGTRQSLQTPLTYAALESRLTITCDKTGGPLSIFYRSERSQGDAANGVVRQMSRPDLADVVARLGGETPPEEARFDFNYSDIVALLQSLSSTGRLVSTTLEGKEVPVVLSIEEQTGQMPDQTNDAPQIPEGRAQEDGENSNVPRIPEPEEPQPRKDQKPALLQGRPN